MPVPSHERFLATSKVRQREVDIAAAEEQLALAQQALEEANTGLDDVDAAEATRRETQDAEAKRKESGRGKPKEASAETGESPIADLNAPEAIEAVQRMRSVDKLKEIIANDQRATVRNAAEARLNEIGG